MSQTVEGAKGLAVTIYCTYSWAIVVYLES